jgi:tetratricopeptide (TPR) repeat protein
VSALDWLRRKNVEGMVLLLARSADPLATLRHRTRQIDYAVVTALIGVCYQLTEDGELDTALRWTELAEEASLLGGTVHTQADVCLCRSTVLWHIAESLPKEEDWLGTVEARGLEWKQGESMEMRPGPQALAHLKTALEWADKALAVCEQANFRSDIPHVRNRQAVIHASAGRRIEALQAQIDVVIAWTRVPGSPEPPALDLSNVADRYWSLRPTEIQAGAEALAANAKALLSAAVMWSQDSARADLQEVLGDVFRRGGMIDNALDLWEQAAAVHKRAGARADEYRIRRKMQHHGHRAGACQRAVNYGHECISLVRTAGVQENLGECLHNLAASYRVIGDTQKAIAAYREAAALLQKEPDPAAGRTSCLLEIGLLEMEALRQQPGLFGDARRDLEMVLSSSGTGFHYWIAHESLAELFMHHSDDISAAVHHADQALEMSVTAENWTRKPAARAHSLNLSGLAHRVAGDNETAISRFKSAIEIISAGAESFQLIVNEYYSHWVMPPELSQVAGVALDVCREARLVEDARYFQALYSRAAEQDPDSAQPETASDDEFDEAFRAFQAGIRLEHADPVRAARKLEQAARLLEGEDDAGLLLHSYLVAGRCWLRANNNQSARECAERALALATEADLRAKLACFDALAAIWLREGDFAQVHRYLSDYVDLTERYRVSLPTAEERIRFLQGQHLQAYAALIYVCLRLGMTSEALEAAELGKSRTLADLLSQAQRKPIDYGLAEEARRLGGALEHWIGEFGQQFFDYKPIDDPDELLKSDRYRMVTDIINLREQHDVIQERAKSSNVLERIDAAQKRLKITDIRSLLHP